MNATRSFNGYVQYIRPGVDTDSGPNLGSYAYTNGNNGFYLKRDDGTEIGTVWVDSAVNIHTNTFTQQLAMNSIGLTKNYMQPTDYDIEVKSISMKATKKVGVSQFLPDDSLPTVEQLSDSSNLDYTLSILYYYTSLGVDELVFYGIHDVRNCATYCIADPILTPTNTPTPSQTPTPSTSCIPPLPNQKRHCITGMTSYGKTFSGYYKFDTNTLDTNPNPLMGSYPHNPLGWGYIYLVDQDGQVIETNPSVKVIGVGVLADPGNQLDIASNNNIEVPDIPGETTLNVNINFVKINANPATILATDAIPPTPLPLTDYAGTIRVYYELDSNPGTTYLRTWIINVIIECNQGCPLRRVLEAEPSYRYYLRKNN